MIYLEFYPIDNIKENWDDPEDPKKPKIKKEEVESYYNISWVNNKNYINVALQEDIKFETINQLKENMSDQEIYNLRNSWKHKVSKLRLRSIPHWSVKQRKKPIISTTELHIRAGFNDLIDENIRNIIHWGSNNYLAVILNEAVRIYHFDNFRITRTFNRKFEIHLKNNKIGACLRWNRAGNYIAIAAKEKEIEVWNPVNNECKFSYRCKCEIKTCRIESMEWSKSDKLISGCNNGCLCIYNKEHRSISFNKIHDGSIIKITLSSQDQYLATSGTDKRVKIWTMPNCVPLYTFVCNKLVKAIAWHPWTEHHFVIGGYTDDNLLTLWNAKQVDSFCQLQSIPRSDSDIFTVSDLTFNPTSGELVVSYAVSQHNISGYRGLIFVYSNLQSMVDIIHWHQSSVLYLLWNNDGSKLFSLDILGQGMVWDFLGNRDETFLKYQPYLAIPSCV